MVRLTFVVFAGILAVSAVLSQQALTQQLPRQQVPSSKAEISLSFAPVVKRAAPAVVNIYTRTRMVREFDDPIFEMLFGRRLGPRSRDETSLGSGVIVREDGIVVTNSHVVEGADEITVALNDRREFQAELLLMDERNDLAILKVDAKELPVLSFRDSDTMEVGDLVLAIGNPFGVGQTVTSGIVSAQTRTNDEGRVFIQTDAAINPGNSGGALVDMSGQLVGINTQILSRSGGSNGIGFAIPADLARRAVESAASGAFTIEQPWIGADGQPVTQEIAESLGVRPDGVILSDLHPSSPLIAAGLKAGDIVLNVSGRSVRDMVTLAYRLGNGSLGESLTVEYWRDGESATADVELIAAPEEPPRDLSEVDGSNPLRGVVIANINPALAQEQYLDPTLDGVIVMQVGRGPGRRYGVRPGDRILSINGYRIESVEDVAPALDAAGRSWRISIDRGGRTLRLAVDG